jgi:hypothetical protein
MRVKKAQVGKVIAKKKPAAKDSVESEMFPGKMIPKEKSNYENKNFDKMFKPAPKKKEKSGSYKYKEGGSLGMKSVKAGYDSNPGVTRADIIVAAKKEAKGGVKVAKKAKSGAALKKQAAKAIAMKKAGKSPKKAMGGMKMMKGGGKCKYGC